MNRPTSIASQVTSLLMLVIFTGFTISQDMHFVWMDHHEEQEECTAGKDHHFHESYQDDHCSICYVSTHTFPKPAVTLAENIIPTYLLTLPFKELPYLVHGIFPNRMLRGPPIG